MQLEKETTVEAWEICRIRSRWNESDKPYPFRGPLQKFLDLDTKVNEASEPIYLDREVNHVPNYFIVKDDDWVDEDGKDEGAPSAYDDLLNRLRGEIKDIKE